MNKLKSKDLLGLEYITKEEIELILETAIPFKRLFTHSIKKVPTLRGKTVALLFYEPSTRTRLSFELASKRLSADTLNITLASSSIKKGESLIDTGKNLEAMKVDFVILRHPSSGASEVLAPYIKAHIINAGDGSHEHPTQGLLDIFTMRQYKKKIAGLKVTIIGDIIHSRVARSNIWGLKKLGAHVTVCGPSTLLPWELSELGVEVTEDLKKALSGADVVNILRIQLERQQENLFPSLSEYYKIYGINDEKLKLAKSDCIVLHPGPMNRGVEIASEVADGKHAVILEQVTNGIAVRMAVLYLLGGGGGIK